MISIPFMGPGAASCSQVAALLQSFLDGEVSSLQRRRLAMHLRNCPACGEEADVFVAIKDVLAARASDLPEDAINRLEAIARAAEEQ